MTAHHHGSHHHDSVDKHRRRLDVSRAARLDDPARFVYLPTDDVVAFVDAPRSGVVLDFGTGTGAHAIAFAKARPDCTVVGLDHQPGMLELLRAKPDAGLVRSGGPELLATLAGTITTVFAINVFHELEDADVRALFAALAPSATATFIDWNPNVERPAGPPPESLYGAAEAEQRLAPMGFTLEKTRLFPYHFALRGRVRVA